MRPASSTKEKGTLQKATPGSYRVSSKFPFLKRNPSSKTTPSVITSKKPKSVASKSNIREIREQFMRSVKEPPRRSSISSFFRPKRKNEKLLSRVRMMKYVIFSLLLISLLISFVYFILSMHDYSQNKNSMEEKKLLRMSIINSTLLFGINLALLVLVNSYWQILDSFSIPLSIAVR